MIERKVIIMRKIITGLGIALTALTLVATNPTATEAKSKYITAKEAGRKIAALQKRCYEKKIKSSTTFSFKAKNEDKAWDFVEKCFNEAAKMQYGKGYGKGLKATSDSWDSWQEGTKLTGGKGSFKFKQVINGKSKAYRKEYRDDECVKKLLIELKGFTKGKSQFDKAWITMCWLKARSTYCEGAHKYTSDYDLYKRNLITDCDGLAGKYAFYAEQAGVKHVGVVSDTEHMWNWIKVNGKRYYIDYQGAMTIATHDYSVKKCVELSIDPFYHDNWSLLITANEWYKENVDPDAKDFKNCKQFWDSLTSAQKKTFGKVHRTTLWAKYELTCSSYSQTQFEPLNVLLDSWGNASNPKTWKHE